MSEYAEVSYVVARIMLWIAVVLGAAFPILYHFNTRGTWSFTPIGRHIMEFRTLFFLLLLTTALSPYMPVEVVLTLAIILYGCTLAVLISQTRYVLDPKSMDPEDVLDTEPSTHAKAQRLLVREETSTMKSRPVVITMSLLAALQMLFGGITTLNLPDGSYNEVALTIGAIGTLIVASAQFGVQFYVQNLVTPMQDVAAFRDNTGQIVAGPAAPPAGADATVRNDRTGEVTQ